MGAPPRCLVDVTPLSAPERARCARLDGLLMTEGGLPPGEVYPALLDGLGTALAAAWPDSRDEAWSEVRVHGDAWSSQPARALAVGGFTLLWPLERALRDPEPVLVGAGGRRRDLSADTIPGDLLGPWLQAQEQSVNPLAIYEAYTGDSGVQLFRFFEVVSDDFAGFDAEQHLRMSDARAWDPDCSVGDLLGKGVPCPHVDLYTLLDQLWWWRQTSVKRQRYRLNQSS